jgi:hypothetical protein
VFVVRPAATFPHRHVSRKELVNLVALHGVDLVKAPLRAFEKNTP